MNDYKLLIENNDNEIGNVYRDGDEYIVEINLWNGNIIKLRTTNCKRITHNIFLTDEIGDIVIKDGTYQFMIVADESENSDVILEIIASDLRKISNSFEQL